MFLKAHTIKAALQNPDTTAEAFAHTVCFLPAANKKIVI
ncbi:hypothetical protein B4099_1098 [Heyndrickxia coagulans]|uniref:Uncharacterized protein n=1 Tax=Heyndrickxia coagulans TaxID=1398 RepID=A0A150KFT9_HEYCO|nr:hypothetical protein B4099_1098 [Heyndrickxia coagulans]